ncbi:MAG: AhpC/TSA family protein [Bernardetiaceae bacterium]|jgi:peroxiredoxin|nr:AhpC/TSA family protein [Bernardetiaceae bacterium]
MMNTLKLAGLGLLLTLVTGLAQAQVPAKPEDISPLLVGEKIPEVSLGQLDGGKVSLPQLVKRQPTVLVFYRGGWCPYCNTQLAGLQSVEEKLKQAGYQIVAVSPDKAADLQASVDKHQLSYTLLADSKLEAAQQFGLAFQAPSQYSGILAKASGGQNPGWLPVPAVYIIAPDGTILFSYVAPNYKQRLSGAVLLAAAEALAKEAK